MYILFCLYVRAFIALHCICQELFPKKLSVVVFNILESFKPLRANKMLSNGEKHLDETADVV